MHVTSSLRGRVEPSPITVALALGDLTAIGVFVVAGEMSHGYDPVTDAGRVAGTLTPFLVGWVLVSVAGGLYTRDAISSVRRAASMTVPAWAVAVVVAQSLRATPIFPGDVAVAFALVSFAVGGSLLLVWRLLATLVASRDSRPLSRE